MNERTKREQSQYNDEELWRKAKNFSAKFGHANGQGYNSDYFMRYVRSITKKAKNKEVLELGATGWTWMLDLESFAPKKLTCINISQNELEKGMNLWQTNNRPSDWGGVCAEFKIMDAHKLAFADNSLDLVYGCGILHHLDFETAIREIHRVLKPGGFCVFHEPLRDNPVGKLARLSSPKARTADEHPLGKAELAILERYFVTRNRFSQLFFVPAGVLSQRVLRLKTPYNRLMKAAFSIDLSLEKLSPQWFRRWYRAVYIVGRKRECCLTPHIQCITIQV